MARFFFVLAWGREFGVSAYCKDAGTPLFSPLALNVPAARLTIVLQSLDP
jgi:hypothetical protein